MEGKSLTWSPNRSFPLSPIPRANFSSSRSFLAGLRFMSSLRAPRYPPLTRVINHRAIETVPILQIRGEVERKRIFLPKYIYIFSRRFERWKMKFRWKFGGRWKSMVFLFLGPRCIGSSLKKGRWDARAPLDRGKKGPYAGTSIRDL